MLELVQRDDKSSPPKGLIAARELMSENVAAIFGGLDTPVSLAMVPVINKDKRIYMGVWAAATGITHNGADPNYAFRVSAVDALVDVKLLKFAHQKFGSKKAGLMLINNPWGQSNEKGLVGRQQGRSVDRDRRHRKIRDQPTSTWSPQLDASERAPAPTASSSSPMRRPVRK